MEKEISRIHGNELIYLIASNLLTHILVEITPISHFSGSLVDVSVYIPCIQKYENIEGWELENTKVIVCCIFLVYNIYA